MTPNMKKIWRLPWRGKMVPHATLDITRECNVSCESCYNLPWKGDIHKPLEQIKRELAILKRNRNLASVALLGGEPTTHPKLYDIIEMVHGEGLEVEILSNGLLVNSEMCGNMKKSGLTTIFFHIEPGQKRRDLPRNASHGDINDLRREKIKTASAAGITAGLVLTVYPEREADLKDAVTLAVQLPELSYLMVTLYRDDSVVESLYGDINNGFYATGKKGSGNGLTNMEMARLMKDEFNFEPFAFLGSNINPEDPRWLSYLVGVVYENGKMAVSASLKASLLEKTAMLLFRFMKRKYPMHMPQNPKKFINQLTLNALLGGNREANHALLDAAKKDGSEIRTKRIFFQHLAELDEKGEFTHCDWCPDALVKNGNLVPICIADREKDNIPLFRKFPELAGVLPYVSIADIPSPIEEYAKLAEDLNIGGFFVKRDDLTGSDYGSNKIRKLEFLLGMRKGKKPSA